MDIKVKITREENAKYYNVNLGDIVTVDFDDYVCGVVASEIGNSDVEACKAQAVAARTYAYRCINTSISDSSSTAQAFRAPRAFSNSYKNARKGTADTSGQVLYYNSKLVNPCSYSANNGGRTTSSESRWGSYRAYLIEQDDPWDSGNKTGHGVGMSQRGIKKAASLGIKYEDMLKFYYPGTSIINISTDDRSDNMSTEYENKRSELREWVLSKVGCGYVWGATGQILTESGLKSMADSNSNVKYDTCKKWIGKQVFDCATLVSKGLGSINIPMCSGASSQYFEKTGKKYWELKGTVDNMPSNRILIMYRATSLTVMQHTGYNLGDGIQVDARGSSSGVIKSNYGTYKWTHWAIPIGLYSNEEIAIIKKELGIAVEDNTPDTVIYQARVSRVNGYLNLRETNSKTGRDIGDIQLDSIVDVFKVDKNTGMSKISYNGSIGYVVSVYLDKINDKENIPDPDTGDIIYRAEVVNVNGYLNLRETNSKTGKDIGDIPIGEIVDVLSTDDSTGMSKISWNNKSGYVMSKYLQKISSNLEVNIGNYKLSVECNSQDDYDNLKYLLEKYSDTIEILGS